jgi:hypothetical protein
VNELGNPCQEHTDYQVKAIERFDKKHGFPYGFHHEKATHAQLEEERSGEGIRAEDLRRRMIRQG